MMIEKFMEDLRRAYNQRDDLRFEGALEALKGAIVPPLQVTIGARERANRGDVTAAWICGMFPEQTKS